MLPDPVFPLVFPVSPTFFPNTSTCFLFKGLEIDFSGTYPLGPLEVFGAVDDGPVLLEVVTVLGGFEVYETGGFVGPLWVSPELVGAELAVVVVLEELPLGFGIKGAVLT